MKTARLVLVVVCSVVLLLNPVVGRCDQPQDNETSSEQATPLVIDVPRDWVSAYLADNLGYSDEQIQEFKDNVAEMPEEQLKTLLRRLAFNTNVGAATPHVNATSHNVNLQRMLAAKAEAGRRGSPTAPNLRYAYQNRQDQTRWYNAPGNFGLFRGYSVLIIGD